MTWELFFFNTIDQRLLDFLRETSHHGLKRVLAIAASNSTLTNGTVWRLLQAGASDVFSWDHPATPEREVKNRLDRWNTVDQLVRSPLVQNNLVGQSPAGSQYYDRS